VHLQDSLRTAIVSVEALAQLCAAAGDDAAARFGRAMGEAMGSRVAKRVGADGATTEAFVEHLGGELAVCGLGVLAIERWGRALVFVVQGGGVPASVTGALLEGALQKATGRAAASVRLMQEPDRERYLLTSEQAARQAVQWLAEGASWGEVLVKLHGAQQAPGARGDA
jgi:hypothetical protein